MKEYYVVAEAANTYDLEEAVMSWMTKGYVCQGGIYCNDFLFFKRYYQALIKYED